MMMLRNRIIHLLIIVSAITVINFISIETVLSADNAQIVLDENLKPGMTLKDAVELLGPPEKIKVSDTGTIVIPYDNLGLSIELKSGGTVIEKINTKPSFKGRFATGIESSKTSNKETVNYIEGAKKLPGKVQEEVREEVKEELREELRDEVKKELREEVLEEVNKEVTEEFDVFDLYGFKVSRMLKGVVITEIRPGSVAEKGGLKVGEIVRKAFYKGGRRLNIFSVSGMEAILKRAVVKRKKTINILQDKNYYYKVEVPKRQ